MTEPSELHVDLGGAKRKPDRWQPEWIREKYFDPPEEESAEEESVEAEAEAPKPEKSGS